MRRIGRREQLELLPHWLAKRIEVNRVEILRLLDQARQEIPQGAWFLDAGAGEGRYKDYFAHTRYVALDLAVGDSEWQYSDLDLVGDLTSLPLPDASFEAAICIQTLEHVNEPLVVLQEIGRVLQPGGTLYLSAPQGWHQHQKPHDYFRYTSFGLRHLLKKSGFRVVDIRPMGGCFWFLSMQFQMLHVWLFPYTDDELKRLLTLPIRLAIQSIFFILLPLLLFYLDRLDKKKDQTLGWVCKAVRV